MGVWVWVGGWVGVWVCGCVVCGCVGVWVCGCVDVPMPFGSFGSDSSVALCCTRFMGPMH